MLTQTRQHSTETSVGATIALDIGVVARDEATRGTGAGRKSRVAAEHGDARTILGATKGDHMLADVGSNNLAMVRSAVGEDVLDQVISELITSDC